MSVTRYEFTVKFGVCSKNEYARHQISSASMEPTKTGSYVRFEDYKHLSDYCDHLVSFSKLPCLPKDLEVLREANAKLATQNYSLLSENQAMSAAIDSLKETNSSLEAQLSEAILLRDKWWRKWRDSVSECVAKVDSVKDYLDKLVQKANSPHE